MAEKKVKSIARKVSKGESYGCDLCGLVVTVDEACGCEDTVIICCDQPMKARKPKAKAAK